MRDAAATSRHQTLLSNAAPPSVSEACHLPQQQQEQLEAHIARGDLTHARHLFDGIPNPDARAYNSLIRAYSWRGPAHATNALTLYAAMLRDGRSPPNKYTFPFALKACSALLDLRAGRAIHRHAARAGLGTDLFVSTALIDLSMKCARFHPATAVFHAMPARDAVAWNAMLAGYALHGMYQHALQCLLRMQDCGRLRPNASTLVALLPLLAQQSVLCQGKSVHAYSVRACLHDNYSDPCIC